MGWSLGFDSNWDRDIGYGVPAHCDQPRCTKEIDRGLSFVCGGEPYGGELGCGLYFCGNHLWLRLNGNPSTFLCKRCISNHASGSFKAKPDHPKWIRFKLRDKSWKEWRAENPEKVKAMKNSITEVKKGKGK